MGKPVNKAAWLGVVLAVFCGNFSRGAEPLLVGVDANYSIGMEREGRRWRWGGNEEDLFRGIARSGVRGFRVRLWTGENGTNGKEYATEVVKRALDAGLDPYLVIFLSEDWADLMKQPAPAMWKDLDIPARAEAVRVYAKDIVTHFRAAGLKGHLYEIGNEIDYGICGVYPGKSTRKNAEGLGRQCWPDAAQIILAAQAGVREADPEARFLLHIAHWWDPDFCEAFFRFMLDRGVAVDYAGLSYFPSSNIGGSLEMEQFGHVAERLGKAIGRPIIVPETAYPSTSDFKGQFSRWKKAAPGYPLTPAGQERWIQDFIRFCAASPSIHSVYYWSPEWYGEGMWKAFALFDPQGESRPAWAAFAAEKTKLPAKIAFFEVRDGRISELPVAEARRQASEILDMELARHGRVNTDYIGAITARELEVGGYRVNLRASLSGNLDLSPAGEGGGTPDWKGALSKVAPETRVVLFGDESQNAILDEIGAAAKKRGLEVLLHVQPREAPFKFGLGSEPRKNVSDEG